MQTNKKSGIMNPTNEQVLVRRRELKKQFNPSKNSFKVTLHKYRGVVLKIYLTPSETLWSPRIDTETRDAMIKIVCPELDYQVAFEVFDKNSNEPRRYVYETPCTLFGEKQDNQEQDNQEQDNQEQNKQTSTTMNTESTVRTEDIIQLNSAFGKVISDKIDQEVERQVSTQINDIKAARIQEVKIQFGQTLKRTSTNDKHGKYVECLKVLSLYKKLLMVGDKGSGKSTIARQISKDLGLPFASYSCNVESTKSELTGYMSVNQYITPQFLNVYENGGLFFVDEFDAMPASVSIVLNAAIDGSPEIAVPTRMDNPVATKHEDFYIVFAGNTYGSMSMEYSARENQDAAFMDRLMVSKVEIGYDQKLEKNIFAEAYDTLMDLRKAYSEAFGDMLSTRNLADIDTLLRSGETMGKAIEVITLGKGGAEKATFAAKTTNLKAPAYKA